MSALRLLLLLASAASAGCTIGPVADCATNPASSPIYVYLNDVPAGTTASNFTVTAVGSKGDMPSLSVSGSPGSIFVFTGTGGPQDETYQITVTFNGTTIAQTTVGWSVNSCGFVENVDVAMDASF